MATLDHTHNVKRSTQIHCRYEFPSLVIDVLDCEAVQPNLLVEICRARKPGWPRNLLPRLTHAGSAAQ
eukprot:8179293-Pyramimonas_sp.AAC.1